jgi:hypothetical protein
MFLVSDTPKARHEKIRSFLEREPVIAVLLAAVDFEWTVRRAILALGNNPTKFIRENVINRTSGLDDYKESWREEVKPRFGVGLAGVIPAWEFFKTQAYPLRNRLVHGVSGTVGTPYATKRVEAILRASAALVTFAECHSEPIYGRHIRRTKPCVPAEALDQNAIRKDTGRKYRR